MRKLFLGLDLGTTSLIGRVCGADGQVLAEASLDNPQQQFGADVISRIEAALAGYAVQLQTLLVEGINDLINDLLAHTGADPEQFTAAAAAANPTISLLLAGETVEKLVRPPYRPDYLAGEPLDCDRLGVDLPVPLYLMPLVSGYVGGDLLSVLLASSPDEGPTLYIDLGTNAELALWDGVHWWGTSVAAGPAFEAGNLRCGMRYGFGAVTEVGIVRDQFTYTVAGGGTPKGICGSGLFSLFSCALQAGLIAPDGRIRSADEIDSNLARYLVADAEGQALQLYRDARTCLLLTQQDVRAFQLAKGAVRAGVNCLLERNSLSAEQLSSVRIAGALGGALPVTALKGVAMLPENVIEKCRFLPGVVLNGLLHVLQQEDGAEQAKKLASSLKVYPLSGTPAFQKAFLASLDFL
ncbi:ASKHA domain-containing protein [Malonomonas rubra]|uniref:ASKHA domain-containing protein n=1 Tax=Malonomonas rubra TaxID=57040 RepID=UPI0026F0AA83|nr:ASKHA domain-containing protein [Malonomonas rubra]